MTEYIAIVETYKGLFARSYHNRKDSKMRYCYEIVKVEKENEIH